MPEAVNVEFERRFDLGSIREILESTPGVVVMDNPKEGIYPVPANVRGQDEVFVGRIRLDESHERAINLWIVSDNLRKGAATNAIQIAECCARVFSRAKEQETQTR